MELKAANQFAYLHYIGRHAEYGDAVFVNPKLHVQPAVVRDEILSAGYVTFYPVTAAVAGGLVEIVGHLPPPALPQQFRRAGARSGRHIVTWIIEDGANEILRRTLSDEERRLPIASIWNHEFLIHRILEGWDPTQK